MTNNQENSKAHYNNGIAYIQQNKLREAINSFTLDINSVNTYGAIQNRAFCYAQLGDFNSSISDYQTAHEITLNKINSLSQNDPNRKAYINELVQRQTMLGQFCSKAGRFEESVVYFQTAIMNCIEDPSLLSKERSLSTLYSNSAVANLNLKNNQESARDMANAIRHSTSDAEKQQIYMFAEMNGLLGLVRQFV